MLSSRRGSFLTLWLALMAVAIVTLTARTVEAQSTVFRVTEHRIFSSAFSGTTLDITVGVSSPAQLSPNYFVIIRGGSQSTTDTGPNSDYVRVTRDPFGTGDLE